GGGVDGPRVVDEDVTVLPRDVRKVVLENLARAPADDGHLLLVDLESAQDQIAGHRRILACYRTPTDSRLRRRSSPVTSPPQASPGWTTSTSWPHVCTQRDPPSCDVHRSPHCERLSKIGRSSSPASVR